MKKETLNRYIGKKVKVILTDGKIVFGTLGFAKEFSAEYGYRKPNFYYVENWNFRAYMVRRIEVMP